MTYYHDPSLKDYKVTSSNSKPMFDFKTMGTTKWVDQSNPDPVKSIQSEIWAGAGSIEICAPGTGRGSPQAPSFEQFDINQRQAIREMIKVNQVDVTTHATPSVTLSGLSQRGFSKEQHRQNREEIMKAIDFAAEAVYGGSVVAHTGEFPRTIGTDAPVGFNAIKSERDLFESFKDEKKEAMHHLVDYESGELITSVKENQMIHRPKVLIKDGKKQYIRDANDNKMYDEVLVHSIASNPEIQKKHNFKKGEDESDFFKRLPEAIKDEAAIVEYERDTKGNIKIEDIRFEQFKKDERDKIIKKVGSENEQAVMKETLKEFFKEQMYGQILHSLGQARQLEREYEPSLEQHKQIKEQLKEFENIDKNRDPEKWKAAVDAFNNRQQEQAARARRPPPPRIEDPVAELNEMLSQNLRSIQYGSESAIGGRRQANEIIKRINNAETIEEFAEKRTTDNAAELGIYAWQKTLEAKSKRPKDEIKPIQLTLENIYPTMQGQDYGSHPHEIITIVKKARDEMAKRLMENSAFKVKSKEEAEKLAKDHIGATLDTGHLNMWRKHFIKKEDESQEAYDKRYKEWYLKWVNKMADEEIIGNVHLADNFGYDDVHLAPGLGNVPLNDILGILKDKGYNKKIQAEGGFHAGSHKGIHEIWKRAGVSVRNDRAGTDAWLDPSNRFTYVHDSYMGAGRKPNFIFKGYAPDSDHWQPWSGTGLE